MHKVTRIVALVAVAWLLLPPLRTQAQQRAAALGREEAAQELAMQAIAYLKRGEDAPDKEAKVAAYQAGLGLAKQAVAADDRNADAHFAVFANQGRLLLLEGAVPNPVNLLRVNRELERCLELDPNHSDALAAQGGMYRQLPWFLGGDLEKAEAALERSIELDPNAVGARIELAEVYRDKRQPARGIELLHQAIPIAQRMNKQRQLGEARRLLAELTQR